MIDSKSEVNTIYLAFIKELGLSIRSTEVRAHKIDNTILDTYKIVVAAFLVMDKTNRVRFFEKTFLIVKVSPKIVFEMLFLILSGADIDFLDQKLR